MSAVRVDVERTAIRLSQVQICRIIGHVGASFRLEPDEDSDALQRHGMQLAVTSEM
jgi:hypothetical protein